MISILSLSGSVLTANVAAVANSVSNGLLPSFGIGGLLGIVLFLRLQVLFLAYAIGVFMLVRAGLRLINSQDDDKLNRAKRTIAGTLVGIAMAHLSLRFVDAFFGAGNALSPQAGAVILSTEIGGIINWVLTTVAVLSILMIVVSAIRSIGTFGNDENAKQVKQTVYGTVLGIGLLIFSGSIKLALGLLPGAQAILPGLPNATPVIARGAQITFTVLSFMGVVAVAIIIYAGMLMVLNFGSDEQFDKAKGIIRRALVGLLIILISSALLFLVLQIVT